MKQWLKITVTTAPQMGAAVSDYAVGGLGCAVETELNDEVETGVYHLFVARHNLLVSEIKDIVARLTTHMSQLAEIFQVESPEIRWETFKDQDWGKVWKTHFTPFHITPDCVIVPTWEKYVPEDNERVIVMDPGMAFGTGHHATTSLAMKLLEKEVQRQGKRCSVLDVGCGTGVLGIAACLIGAGSVTAIDNDPVAVTVARENGHINKVAAGMQISDTPVSRLQGRFSLVVANIVHDVLAEIADDLKRLTAVDGRLILSGVLCGDQVKTITGRYEKLGFTVTEMRTRDGWAALLLTRISSHD